MQPVELSAGGIRLRPWRADDVDDVLAAMQDPVMQLWNGLPASTRPEAEAFLRRRGDWSGGGHASWAVVDTSSEALLGSLSLHSIDLVQGGASVGYWTVPAARGGGVASTAADVACRWAFGALAVDRIELCHAVENPASARVAEKAGFTYEGHLRRSYRYGDGIKHDELLWSRLSDDPPPSLSSRS
jgi:RimJ/RimL family protein N-acetyltransferase